MGTRPSRWLPPASPCQLRRLALQLAGAALVLAGCAHVGKLSLPEQKTLSPVQARSTPQSGTEPGELATPMTPLFAVGDTVLGFLPGTADSSKRYLGRLLRGYTADTLNIVIYGDNRPGYRTTALSSELEKMKGILSLKPKKMAVGLINIPVFLFKGFIPDLKLVRDTPALITKQPTWGREKQVRDAILTRVDSLQAYNQTVTAAINTGDLVKDGRRPKNWDRFLSLNEPLSSRVPYFAVAGNHERTDDSIGVANWRTATGLPVGSDRLYYCFDSADGWVRFIAIDTNPIVDPQNRWSKDVHVKYSKEQFDWMIARVREHHGPAIIMMHHPPFSAGFHREEWQADQVMRDRRSQLVKALHETGISVIASGHEHAYERALMTWQDAVLLVIATGGAGAPLTALPPPAASAEMFAEYKVSGGVVKPENVLTDVVFHYCLLRLWFGGGELYTYAVNKDASTTQIDKVAIDLKRYGIPKIDQKKMPIPEASGPKEKKTEGEKPGQATASSTKADTSAASRRILTQPAPAKKKAPAKHGTKK
jgi:hypothetical protein